MCCVTKAVLNRGRSDVDVVDDDDDDFRNVLNFVTTEVLDGSILVVGAVTITFFTVLLDPVRDTTGRRTLLWLWWWVEKLGDFWRWLLAKYTAKFSNS
jgi:hypothetical protein